MSLDFFRPKGLRPAVSHRDVVAGLLRVRRTIERGAGSIQDVDLSAALLLADVCDALGLDATQRLRVLGHKGCQFVDATRRTKISLAGPHK